MTNSKCTFILDSGADVSLFKVTKVPAMQIVDFNKKLRITGVTEGVTETIAEAQTSVTFDNNLKLVHSFQLVSENFPIPTDGILGRDFLVKFRCTIDYDNWLLNFNFQNHSICIPIEDSINNSIILPPRCEVIRRLPNFSVTEDSIVLSQEILPGVFCGNTIVSSNSPYIKFVNTTQSQVAISNFHPICEPLHDYVRVNKPTENLAMKKERIQNIFSKINFNEIPSYVHSSLKKLIEKYSDIFSLENEKLSHNNFYSQNILLNDQVPVYIPNYKTIHSQGDEMAKQIQKLLDDDIIEPSVSPYNSPILLVPKKAGNNSKKWRLVVDFRQLNKKVLADKFPLPRIDIILDQLGRAKYFSTLDLMSGFHQIPLDQESRKYTAFSAPNGHFHFKRLPFGLNISPNSFQRMMTIAMAGLNPECAFIYIDDIIVIGCSENHHFQNLTTVFERLRHYNLKLNPAKCKFFLNEVTFLGHKVTDRGILPDDSKFEALKNYPKPNNVDEVRRFVAFCNYYRKFVPNFADIARPLNALLKKGVQFQWTDSQEQSFQQLKQTLMEPYILRYPDFSREFILTTDASNYACGAVLSQRYTEGDFPIAFASRSFTQGERNKPTIEKELAAIHWAVNYFKSYLYGRRFTIKTDHRPLVYLFNMKKPTSKLTLMRLDLEEYNFNIEFLAGKSNVCADALSRIPLNSDDLKSLSVLVVNTRAMNRKKLNDTTKFDDSQLADSETDHLTAWQTENPSEVRKYLKVGCEVHHNQLKVKLFNNNYNKMLQTITIQLYDENTNGSQALELALLELGKLLNHYKRTMVAISLQDELFKSFASETVKEIANRAISNYQLVLYNPPTFIQNVDKINEILVNNHMTPTGGHIGQHKLYLKLREKFTWKNMKLEISNFVKNCEKCKINKVNRHTKEPVIVTSTPFKPFETISIDTAGPFGITNNRNRYILTIQCNLTKYIVLAPVPTKEASVMARALVENFILIYGNFLQLNSDQGTEFNNDVFEQICKLLEIKQTFATAYHPQTIGALERNHRCLNEYLRSFTNTHNSDWDDWTKFFAFSYNTTPNIEHGYTPYELVFGRKATLPHDLQDNQSMINPVYNPDQYYQELRYKLQTSNSNARNKLIFQKEKRKNVCNQNINKIDLNIGDLVYLTNENRKKLDPFYIGPFTVTKIADPNCTVKHNNTHKETIVHKNRTIKI